MTLVSLNDNVGSLVGNGSARTNVFCFMPCVSAPLPRCGQNITVRSFPGFFSLDATLVLYRLDGDVGSFKLWDNSGAVLPLNMKVIIFLAILLPALILSVYNGESRETKHTKLVRFDRCC